MTSGEPVMFKSVSQKRAASSVPELFKGGLGDSLNKRFLAIWIAKSIACRYYLDFGITKITLPSFFSSTNTTEIERDRMDIRRSRCCGNVCKLPASALLWETCLQAVGKDLAFSMGCEWVFHRHKRQFSTFP